MAMLDQQTLNALCFYFQHNRTDILRLIGRNITPITTNDVEKKVKNIFNDIELETNVYEYGNDKYIKIKIPNSASIHIKDLEEILNTVYSRDGILHAEIGKDDRKTLEIHLRLPKWVK